MNTTTLNMTTLDGGNVIIKKGEGGGSTPTPPSGGESGGGESGGSNMEYLDVRAVDSEIKMLLLNLSFLAKIPQDVEMGGNTSTTINAGVSPSAGWGAMYERYIDDAAKREIVLSAVTACGIDFSTDVIIMGQFITINDIFTMYGMSEYIDSLPRLTKEQFYSLD